MKKEGNKEKNNKVLAENRKAFFNYFLSDFTECGIVLVGTEIKAIRVDGLNINDSYVTFKDNEAYVINTHIPLYKEGNIFNHEPTRTRKLLLHKKEMRDFQNKVKIEGYTLMVTKVYLKNGKVKVVIALGKGKKNYDKRETIKQRNIERKLKKGLNNDF